MRIKNIELHNFGSYAGHNSFSFESATPEERVVIIGGKNGAGKTTLINHIIGVLKPESGEITVDGQAVFENDNIKQRILSIADDWFYFSTATVAEMAKFYENIYKNFSRERYEAIKEAESYQGGA